VSVRTKKVGSLVKEELSVIIQRNYSISEYGFITITDVMMSPDLKVAKVYVSIFGDEEQKTKSLNLLESQKPAIRSMLAKVVRLRYAPELLFYIDKTIDNAIKLENIFQKIHENDKKNTEQSSPAEA
jgi:ribosome-binding factor A